MNFIKKWLMESVFRADLAELQRTDIDLLRANLKEVLARFDDMDESDADCLPCKASARAIEALKMLHIATGRRTRVPWYAVPLPSIREMIFGWKPKHPVLSGRSVAGIWVEEHRVTIPDEAK